jgi:DNA-directed RNA polymerase-5 subunit 1
VLGTELSFETLQRKSAKSNKEYGDSLYDFLTLVKTDQEKARYTFLEDVQQPRRLPEQNGIVEN